MTTTSEPVRLSTDELRTLFLFEKLNDDQLEWLHDRGRVVEFEAGPVYAEGDPATCFYVLLTGTIAVYRSVGGDEVETTRTDQRGVYTGAWLAYLGDRVPQVYQGGLRSVTPTTFFVLDAAEFADLMQQWFPMALHMLEGAFWGYRNQQATIGQRERLLALGSLSAGLTHELNNPAAAAVRATSALRERVAGMRHKLGFIAGGHFPPAVLQQIIRVQEEAVERAAKAPQLSPIEAGDREDELGDWLDDHGVSGGWEVAPSFVQAGLDPEWLQEVLDVVGAASFPGAVKWLGYTVETEQLMNEIADASTRISTLVGSAKEYSQLDRAPYQVVDVHDLLDSTVVMLAAKLKGSVELVKDYDRTLPQIPCYAAELNQVWTNLIDNAVGAMPSGGTLTLRTYGEHDQFVVEVADTGSGIDPKIAERIFEPFFTTKGVGEGTGLGLDISWRIVVNKHHGSLTVTSVPGDTRFRVALPFVPPAPLDS